jgi:exodeoxyribonuclease V beta subunit
MADLVLRLVAEEGLPLDRILVVTFTRAATAELRLRVHARLRSALCVLGPEFTAREAGPDDDPVLARLAGLPERHLLRLRVGAALEAFDTAAISTIHGFCQRMLGMHAFTSQTAFDQELCEDASDLLAELVDDWLTGLLSEADARTAEFWTQACGLKRARLIELARLIGRHPEARLEPAEPRVEPREALEAWRSALERFRTLWAEGGRQALLEAMEADRALRRGLLERKIYKRGQADKFAERLQVWLEQAGLPGRGKPTWAEEAWVRFFTARQAAAFTHPVLDAWQALVDLAAPLVQAPWLAFARAARHELPRRLAARGLQTFDGLLGAIRARLGEPALIEALRRQFQAALVDEFQDTDAAQWDIFRAVFGESPGHRLFMIGDPKQAIYAFRGADVFVYLAARRHAPPALRFTMRTNHRADAAYLRALERLFGPGEEFAPGGPFDLESIDYPRVEAAPRLQEPGLRFTGPRPRILPAPLCLRVFDQESLPGSGSKARLTSCVAEWLAADVVELLEAGAEVRVGGGWRPLSPGDLAVLVRKNAQAHLVQRALSRRGVPAVLAQAGSVLETEEALALERWLEAVAEPGREGPARALATSALFGWTGPELEAALDGETDAWARWLDSLHDSSRLLAREGLARAARAALEEPWRPGEPSALERLLAQPGGERRATDLRHVLELLCVAATRERLSPAGLLAWLRARRARADLEPGEASLRLESEAAAVQLVTLHKSKGLQYPVVFLPFAWEADASSRQTGGPLRVHEPAGSETLVLDLHRDRQHEARQAREARFLAEARQEGLRLLYVGLTRARHAALVTWGVLPESAASASLGMLLHGRTRPGHEGERPLERARQRILSMRQADDGSEALRQDLEALGPPLAWTPIRAAEARPWRLPGPTTPDVLSTRKLARDFDRVFRQSSYTSLVAAAEPHLQPPLERALPPPDGDVDFHAADTPAPTPAALPGGREAGRWAHRILEELDFGLLRERADRPGREARPLEELCAVHGRRLGFETPEAHRALASVVSQALSTPLGGALGGFRLRDLALEDRLDELRFELPLAGGPSYRPGGPAVPGAVLATFLERTGGPWPDDYPARLRGLKFPELAGFLTGAVDLVFRLPGPGGARWYLADYKTNRVGPGRAALLGEMARHHYPLQYHLYLVALHRYLRWRLGPAYDYERDVGGSLYLFLRAMDGTPGAGVLFDRPPREVIEGLSRALGEPSGGGP